MILRIGYTKIYSKSQDSKMKLLRYVKTCNGTAEYITRLYVQNVFPELQTSEYIINWLHQVEIIRDDRMAQTNLVLQGERDGIAN